MHIVYLTHEYPGLGCAHGGIGSFIQTLGRALVKNGIAVSVVGMSQTKDGSIENDNGVKIYRIGQGNYKIARFLYISRKINEQLLAIHHRQPIDIIETPELGLAFIKKNMPFKKVIRMHGGHHFFSITLNKKTNIWKAFQERRSFAKADAVCAVSKYVAETTRELLHLGKITIDVIYNPVNINTFYQADNKKIKKGTILFVGTVCEKKGIKQLIAAMRHIVEKYPQVQLNIVGRDWSSPDCPSYIAYLKTLISDSIKNNIYFSGTKPHSEIPNLIEEAEVCVYPSHMEAMPLAWLEVLAMGKCFIGGRIGPGYEAVKENETGLLANPHDSKDIAEKILQVMNNVSFAQDLGMNARKDIIKRFSIDKLIKDNIDFYNRIIQKKQMTFSIITHVLHKKTVTNEIGGYAPYIREMNIWLKQVNKVIVVAPCEKKEFTAIDIAYQHANISFLRVPLLDFTSLAKTLKSSIWVPYIMICIGVAMFRSDHIHLRCPGNMGLLGCICQIFFPWKKKTAKYAGNWDWNSVQPQSYRFQQKLLSNTTFTKNIQVLVYGEWKNSTKNILPFFTASYSEQEKINILPKKLSGSIELLFVGTLSPGKRPLLSVEAVKYLHDKGYDVHLTLLGEGSERKQIEDYIHQFSLDNIVEIKGNVSSEEVKREMQQTHFLLFAPQSEGWPKAVAESMFWGCVPITTRVSCIEQMLGNGSRGALIEPTVESIHQTITDYMGNPETYKLHSLNAQNWSQLYTLERFEKEIKKLM